LSEFLASFYLKIDNRPRKAHGKADALTSQGQTSDEEPYLSEVYHTQTLLKSHNLGALADIPAPNRCPTICDLLQTAYGIDCFPAKLQPMLENRIWYPKRPIPVQYKKGNE
jgi:hypothetical protein